MSALPVTCALNCCVWVAGTMALLVVATMWICPSELLPMVMAAVALLVGSAWLVATTWKVPPAAGAE